MLVRAPKSSGNHPDREKILAEFRKKHHISLNYNDIKNKKKARVVNSNTRKKSFSWYRVLFNVIIFTIIVLFVLLVSIKINIPYVSDYVRTKVSALTPKEYKLKYTTIKLYVPKEFSSIFPEDFKKKLLTINYKGIPRFQFVDTKENADATVDVTLEKPTSFLGEDIFLPVGHLYWIKDNVNLKTLKKAYVYSKDYDLAKRVFADKNIQLIKKDTLLNTLKPSETVPAFVKLSELNPQFKLLSLDNAYFLDNFKNGGVKYYIVLKPTKAPKVISASASAEDGLTSLVASIFKAQGFTSNELPTKDNILSIKMTGVTAITRSLAIKIEQAGRYDYPALKIAKFLKDADLTHTSNEVSFVPGCVPATGTRFCSKPEYAEALKAIGLDIIELTGNHNNDYGDKWNTWSIKNVYKANKWDYFGGGLNAQDAAKILYKDIKGTKVAFIGYNYYDTMLGTHAIAGPTWAGANSFSFAKLKNNIAEAKKNADAVIVDFQFQECYAYPNGDIIYPICYRPLNSPDQRKVFRTAIDYGADIVIGTQAHQPQTYEVYKNKPIFYGLGNLFFDQTPWIGTRQGLILTHYFYKGKHLQTRITTTIYNNAMQTYVTHGKDRELLLKLLKNAR